MDKRLALLWGSDGSDYCLSTAQTMRQILLPATERMNVVTVAPLSSSRAAWRRLFTSEGETKDIEREKADEAARTSVDALGEARMPIKRAVRWGSPSSEIVKEASDLEPT